MKFLSMFSNLDKKPGLETSKFLSCILGIFSFGIFALGEEIALTSTFSNKTASGITVTPDDANYTAAFVSLEKTTYSDGSVSAISQKTSGSLAAVTTYFTPDSNVQNSGSWEAVFSLNSVSATSAFPASGIYLGVVMFGSSGAAQSSTNNRIATFSAEIQDSAGTVLGSGSLTKTFQGANATSENCAFTFDNAVSIEPNESYKIVISAKKSTETLGCFFGLYSIALTGTLEDPEPLPPIEDTTIPRGYTEQTLPAGTTSYVQLNTRQPLILDATGTFSVSAETSKITLETDADIDFASIFETQICYLLEVSLENGNATIMLNRNAWRTGTSELEIDGNTLTFDAPALAAILEDETTLSDKIFRIRKAWTLSDVFGTENILGLKTGTALSADSLFGWISPTASVKIYYTGTQWKSLGAAAGKDISLLPLDAHIPLRIVRKAGTQQTLRLSGEAVSGAQLVPIYFQNGYFNSGISFPQTLEETQLNKSLSASEQLYIGGNAFSYNTENSRWEDADGNAASNAEIDGLFYLTRTTNNEKIISVENN